MSEINDLQHLADDDTTVPSVESEPSVADKSTFSVGC
jgi:hypothetical protein